MRCPDQSHTLPPVRHFQEGETDFLRCVTCGLVFRANFPTDRELIQIYRDAYSDENVGRGATEQESGEYATRAYGEFLTNSLLKPDTRVLDFGAGTGALVDDLRSRNVNVDGLEFSEMARDYCLTHRNFSLLESAAEIPSGSYDLVTMIEVIEHVTEIQSSLREVRRLLAEGGVLFVTTPNRRGLRARFERGNWREATKKFHLYLFDSSSLISQLRLAGFTEAKVVRFSPVAKGGALKWLFARCCQLLSVPGTLCVLARR
jgi:cyclopropane fatty-acyl-phospholipid synthase-like methyltransferase